MNFVKALCDLGASINLMSLSVYRKLGLGDPTLTNMRLVMADRSVKRPVGILNDVLVKVYSFIFPADFVILDCEVDSEVPIILGRPCLATGSVIIDMRDNELLFRLNDEVVRFDICKAMKQPSDMDVFSIAYEDKKALAVKKHLTVEPLPAALLNVEHEDDEDYEELMGALTGIRSYSHTPKQLDLDLTNQPSPTAKTSSEEPPMLESKELPYYLRYVFLESGSILPASVADDLSKQHVEALISALMRYKRAMGRKIDDIIGISPEVCMHKSHIEEDCMPTSILVDDEVMKQMVEVKRVNDKMIPIKLVIGGSSWNIISAYAPHVGLDNVEKKGFWEDLDEMVRCVPSNEKLFIGGNFNGHIGSFSRGNNDMHEGYGFGVRNVEGVALLDFAWAFRLVVVNSNFSKKEVHLVTFCSSVSKTQIDFLVLRKKR
ncbi:hypothetical protein CQW23_16637 [Capsicum baccatum]|uniref:Uncharacterized protein n=1 Tax=Capsicum baccatum TaxID=33114 RepID=A0A2G2WBN6_CAPBA|nr:hypothetical protein CQW23_16637 [Capsicum baccatum]